AQQGPRRFQEAGRGSYFRTFRRGRLERHRGLCPSPAQAARRARRPGSGAYHSRGGLPDRGGEVVLRFKSIISRIVFLHVVAVVITSILMSLALSWLLAYATDNIHHKAMKEQAFSVGEHLSLGADGKLALNLPRDLLGLYSQAYGRYSYAVIDDDGAVLFSSLADHSALFPADTREAPIEFLRHRRGNATLSGASVKKTIGDQTVWIQTGEDLANRD